MAGWKQWQVGDAWTAADANSFLAHQVVPRFATTAARDAAITSPTVAQTAWCSDTGELYIRSAQTSTWVGAVPRIAFKASDTSRASTTALTNDPDLLFALEASSYYVCKISLYMDGDSAGDFKMQGTYSGTLTSGGLNALFLDTTNAASNNTNMHLDAIGFTSVQAIGTITGNQTCLLGTMRLQVSTAGTLRLQWAQNASNASATILRAGSYMSCRKVK